MEALQITWFMLVGVLLTGYAILDGFDLGAGFWHLFTKKSERRVVLNAIAPVWDGNQVWIITGGGAMFAAFPHVYATVFSGFYLALMLLLLALILRAVSLEFRHQVESATWQAVWDTAFGVSCILIALLFSVALGNIMRGVPLDPMGEFAGSFLGLLNPYSLVIGLTGLAMIATHGGLYLSLKAGGELEGKALGWARKAWTCYAALFVLAAVYTFAAQGHLLTNYGKAPVLWLVPVVAIAALIGVGVLARQGKTKAAFVVSGVSIAANWGLVGVGIFPNLVRDLGGTGTSLTVWNASSSKLTLTVMLVVALAFMPVVLAYTTYVYRKFAGKVEIHADSY
jgi:cytochrome d ubiquinol oxidase subunit II